MVIKQLSVFIENKAGRLEDVLRVLKENKINIVSLSLADSSDYGVLRMLVSDPESGKRALKENGISAMLTDVLAVKLSHKVGKLQEVLDSICNASINIEYMYALATKSDDACIVFKTSDTNQAITLLEKEEVEFLTKEDISQM